MALWCNLCADAWRWLSINAHQFPQALQCTFFRGLLHFGPLVLSRFLLLVVTPFMKLISGMLQRKKSNRINNDADSHFIKKNTHTECCYWVLRGQIKQANWFFADQRMGKPAVIFQIQWIGLSLSEILSNRQDEQKSRKTIASNERAFVMGFDANDWDWLIMNMSAFELSSHFIQMGNWPMPNAANMIHCVAGSMAKIL